MAVFLDERKSRQHINRGKSKVIKAAKNLRPLKKFAKLTLKFVSSGEVKKSTKIAGVIIP